MMKVLIVEDEPLVRRDLVLLTPWEELECVCIGGAENGKEAIRMFSEQKPEIIITDIRMPGMDGLELIDIITEMCAVSEDNQIGECIVLSGYSDFEYARKAMRSGVQEYLVKPVDDEELKVAVLRAKKRIEDRKGKDNLEKKMSDTNGGSLLMLFHEYELGERKSVNARYVQTAIALIQQHYIGGITVEAAAEKLSISSGHLSHIFKQETGYTFVDYLVYYRVKQAAELLRDPQVKVYEVADLVGYSDARYFSQIFRRITGMTPREFRESV